MKINALTMPELRIPELPEGVKLRYDRMASGTFNFSQATGEIEIFDAIGEYGSTPDQLLQALKAIGPNPITLKINSPGGDYFAGVAMYNLLRAHEAPVTVQVVGVAASAASVIAMAGTKIEMAKNAELMIHKAWAMAVGNADAMAATKAILDRIDRALAETYAARTGQPIDKISAMMSAETWMNADEAIKLKFADALLERDAFPKSKGQGSAPQSRQQLIDDLRQIGISKSAAKAIAAGGWSALAEPHTPEIGDTTKLLAAVKNATYAISIQQFNRG